MLSFHRELLAVQKEPRYLIIISWTMLTWLVSHLAIMNRCVHTLGSNVLGKIFAMLCCQRRLESAFQFLYTTVLGWSLGCKITVGMWCFVKMLSEQWASLWRYVAGSVDWCCFVGWTVLFMERVLCCRLGVLKLKLHFGLSRRKGGLVCVVFVVHWSWFCLSEFSLYMAHQLCSSICWIIPTSANMTCLLCIQVCEYTLNPMQTGRLNLSSVCQVSWLDHHLLLKWWKVLCQTWIWSKLRYSNTSSAYA